MNAFQLTVAEWVRACFGRTIADDRIERANRFLEEALELYQSCDMSQEDAYRLVNYVFRRPKGELQQEMGGTLVTLAALAEAHRVSMDECAWREYLRCTKNIKKIRAKWRAKPKHGSLPQ